MSYINTGKSRQPPQELSNHSQTPSAHSMRSTQDTSVAVTSDARLNKRKATNSISASSL